MNTKLQARHQRQPLTILINLPRVPVETVNFKGRTVATFKKRVNTLMGAKI